jgi:hypothetical protein
MHKLSTAVLLAAVAFNMMACSAIKGTLQVGEDFKVNTGKTTVDVAKGSYPTTLQVESKGKVLQVDVKLPSGDVSAKFNIPAGSSLSKGAGRVVIKGSDNGQAFDLQAASDTDVEETPVQNDTEACTYYVSEYRCWDEPVTVCDNNQAAADVDAGPNHGGGGPNKPQPRPNPPPPPPPGPSCHTETVHRCGDVNVAHSGWQQVSYHYVTTAKGTSAQIIDPATSAVLAIFSADSSKSNKVYDFQGDCHP